MRENDSKELLLSVFGVALVIIAIIGVTYAVFSYTSNSETENVIKTGAIDMSYVESTTNVISIDNAMPMSDSVGVMQEDYFDFTLSSTITGVATINYDIRAVQIPTENDIEANKIKIYLEQEDGGRYIQILSPTTFDNSMGTGMLICHDSFENKENKQTKFNRNYRLRMWISEDAGTIEEVKIFKLKVNVYANL